jgi:hypothetical protein
VQALPGAVAAPLIAFLGLAAVRDTVVFVATVDIPRLEHVQFNAAEADRAEGHLPPGLEFMRWSRGPSGYDADELTALVRFLSESDGNFLLVGDSSILYGLTGKPSVSPVLWMDPRLTHAASGRTGIRGVRTRPHRTRAARRGPAHRARSAADVDAPDVRPFSAAWKR